MSDNFQMDKSSPKHFSFTKDFHINFPFNSFFNSNIGHGSAFAPYKRYWKSFTDMQFIVPEEWI